MIVDVVRRSYLLIQSSASIVKKRVVEHLRKAYQVTRVIVETEKNVVENAKAQRSVLPELIEFGSETAAPAGNREIIEAHTTLRA